MHMAIMAEYVVISSCFNNILVNSLKKNWYHKFFSHDFCINTISDNKYCNRYFIEIFCSIIKSTSNKCITYNSLQLALHNIRKKDLAVDKDLFAHTQCMTNPRFASLYNESNDSDEYFFDYLDDNNNYLYSTYELLNLAKLCEVNIVILCKKSKRNQSNYRSGIIYRNYGFDKCVLFKTFLDYGEDTFNKFELIYANPERCYVHMSELSIEFKEMLDKAQNL